MPIRQLRSVNRSQSSGFSTHRLSSSRGSLADARSAAHEPPRFPRSPRRHGRRTLAIFKLFGITALLGGLCIVAVAAWLSRDLPDPDKIIDRTIAQSTKIFDRTGKELLYEIHGSERRTLIELTDIPQYAIDATIAVEDKNFFKHRGLSFTGIVRAIGLEALSKVGLWNKVVPGGSTLTQQFVKNAVLTSEKSYTRKLKELVLAYRIERTYSKRDILKMYFNEIPYGSTAYGIEAASHTYFDKAAKDLTLAEAAVLAAMVRAPSYYSPNGSHRDELLSRQHFVLKLMAEQGFINGEQAENAKNEAVAFKKKREDIKAPHFVFQVKEELAQRYGERLVEQGGLTIVTTLDYDKQKIADQAIADQAKTNTEKYGGNNAALVSIDVASGEVLALVGSKDYFDDEIDGQVNVATSLRQPGSSIKPIVYAAAFAKGYRPDTQIYDVETQFASGGKPYKPKDYDGKERGPVTLRQALQGSLNIPAVKVLYLVGVRPALELAQALGYTTLTDPDRYGLSLVLGGGEVRLIEHTNAYAALAREGVYKPYVTVLKVTDPNGKVLEENRSADDKRVLDREVARRLTNVLSDNGARAFIFGASNRLTLSDRPVAAKTGTTNSYNDAWTMGYTPQIATGVWVGNADSSDMKKGADGSVVAAPIWHAYMTKAHEGLQVKAFPEPESLASCSKPMLCGALSAPVTLRINTENGLLASPSTPWSKTKLVTFSESHEILQYVDKDDPAGPVPSNPSAEPQYTLWEEAIRSWMTKQGLNATQPPTEYDSTISGEAPTIVWNAPSPGAMLMGPMSLSVSAAGASPISRVDFYLNDSYLTTVLQQPYTTIVTPSTSFTNGPYLLTAVATDTLGRERHESISVTIEGQAGLPWLVAWRSPIDGGQYDALSPPSELSFTIDQPALIQRIEAFLSPAGAPSALGAVEVVGRSSVSIPLSTPLTAGEYTGFLLVTDASGQTQKTAAVSFSVK